MKTIWCSDLHFDHCSKEVITKFMIDLKRAEPETLLITGDIATGGRAGNFLSVFGEQFPRTQIFYVLGNHDYWDLTFANPRPFYSRTVQWMNQSKPIYVGDKTYMIGVDGWYDCSLGNEQWQMLNDFNRISDLKFAQKSEKLEIAIRQSEKFLKILKNQLKQLPPDCERIVVLTHVPPLQPFLRPIDGLSGFFWWKDLGTLLKTLQQEVVVLCGHTHDPYDLVEGNVRMISQSAAYGSPGFREIKLNEMFGFDIIES